MRSTFGKLVEIYVMAVSIGSVRYRYRAGHGVEMLRYDIKGQWRVQGFREKQNYTKVSN